MALTLDSIGYTYGSGTSFSAVALDGVSASVDAGELLLVLGATGSGKSTLLRICAGLLAADRGSATVDSAPLTRTTARGRVGLVFQDAEAQLFAETLEADVAFGPRNLGVSEDESAARAREALESVGLDPSVYGTRSPFGLSGGEARRAAIAGVLAMRPGYLLLDEPTSGLDARGRAAVRSTIRSAREHAGIVVVSHSAEEFLGEADSVLVLAGGRAVFSGPASDLVRDPSPFGDAGLIAPDVLRFQQAVRDRACDPGAPTLDPAMAAADAIGSVRGCR